MPKNKSFTTEELEELIEEATVDCYDEYEDRVGFLTMIQDNVPVPFQAILHGDPVTISEIDGDDRQILTNIQRYRPELTGYRGIAQAPVTTNIIEGLNSHLEARLFSLRSFQSVRYAKLWFNGYVLKRRFTKFTDCRGKFRFLNGKRGVDMSKKLEIDLPTFF